MFRLANKIIPAINKALLQRSSSKGNGIVVLLQAQRPFSDKGKLFLISCRKYRCATIIYLCAKQTETFGSCK